jgi:DNA-binding transcriptional LysR family regulator
MERFNTDRADYMIVLSMEDVSEGLIAEPLPEIELLLVAAKDHPLSKGKDIDISKRFAELIVRDSSSGFRKKEKESFTGSQHIVWLADFHSKRLAILDGAGFGWMPKHLIHRDLEHGELIVLKDRPLFSWTYHPQLVYREAARLGKASRLFQKILLQTAVQNI